MKRIILLILTFALLCSSISTAWAYSPRVKFSSSEVVENFHNDTEIFFDALGMGASTVKQMASLCKVFEDPRAIMKYGISTYISIDKHILMIEDDFIFSYVSKDGSTIYNICQMPLAVSLRNISYDEAFDILDWMNDAASVHGSVYRGTTFDVYHYMESHTYSAYLFVNHNQQLDQLSHSADELLAIADELLK